MFTDDVAPKFEDGEDDETPEQKKFAEEDGVRELMAAMGWTAEKAREFLGI